MKKSIFVNAVIIALAMLASCQKEQFTENVAPVTGVTEFTATIEQPTKTAIDANGKITWKVGDEITVTDAASASAVYVAGSGGASTTFTLKTGETAVGEGPYTATYGDIANQIYSAEGANYPLAAPATSTTVFKFSSPYAVVKITAKSEGKEVIESVDVNYGENVYALNCGDGVTLTSDGIDFFVAVNQATDAALSATFHTTDDKTATKTRKEAVTLAAKDLLPVTLTFTEGDWESPAPAAGTPDGALKGVFTVDDNSTDDPSDDIRVYFSQGNLYCNRPSSSSNDWKWHFYEKQYKFKTDYPKNESGMSYTTEEDTEMTLFTWGYDPSNLSPVGQTYVQSHPQENDILVYDKPSSEGGDDWGVAYCESNDIPVGTWRTLTTWEWRYLVDTKRMKNVDFSYSDYTGGVNIENTYYKGVFLYPDDYKGDEVSKSMTWDEINDAGIVFLPAAGYRRDGSDLGYYGASICFYWSASAYSKDLAFHVKADGDGPTMYLYGNRAVGHSVRLVTNAAPEGFVDLGVVVNNRPVYWAEKNLGAGEPAEFGYYFSWGDITGQPISKNVFDNDSFEKAFNWANDVFGQSFDKVSEETSCPNGILLPAWDAAAHKNKTWRMPTSEEFHALFEQCFAEWTGNYNNTGKAGVIVWKAKGDDAGWFKPQEAGIGREYPDYHKKAHSFSNKYNPNTDSHVFFPASGHGEGNTFADPSTTGNYWSSTLFNDSKKEDAQLLSFNTNTISINARAYRYYGYPIRPVYVPAPGSTIDYFHVSNDNMSCWE